jgi:hypothetical protein
MTIDVIKEAPEPEEDRHSINSGQE